MALQFRRFRDDRCPCLDHPVDVGLRIADLGEDLAGVLAVQRRGAANAARRPGKLDRQADRLGRPGLGMDEIDQDVNNIDTLL